MHIAKITAAIATAAALNGLAANTWWVDDDKFGASGDGTSAGNAFGTIQEALDNPSFAAGDTVKVLPGVYDQGGALLSGHTNRVAISKSCTLVSTGGAAATHIVGKFSTANANGTGPDAIRCIGIGSSSAVRIEGFTIRGGASAGGTTETASNYGGGVLGASKANNAVVDCVISNCVAWKGAAARNVTAVRTLAVDNVIIQGSGSAFNGANLHFCVVKRNLGGYACSTCGAQNCDLIDNANGIAGSGSYYNCLIYSSLNNGVSSSATLVDCCLSADRIVAPALGDYRPIAGSELDGTGEIAGFSSAAAIPDAERYFDFLGNAVPGSGACDIGAVQGAVATAGALQVGTGGLVVDGVLAPAKSLIFATTYPTQWIVRAVPVAGKWEYGFQRTSVQTDRIHSDLNGDAFVMPPPTGVSTVTTVYAERAFWVNPNLDDHGDPIGSDANPGTEESPFRTLQKAMDASADSVYTVVFAAAGSYNEGGRCIHEVQVNGQTLTNRVCSMSNNNCVRLVGAGPGRSFIVGAPDPDTGGNGPKAVRPLGIFCNYVAIQGFTLTNGWSAAASAGSNNDKYGAVYGRHLQGMCVHMLDCEVTDCHGELGMAINMILSRCTFHDNFSDTARGLVQCNASSCLLEGSAASYASRQVNFYHSTLVAASPELAFSSNYNTFVASIVSGGKESRSNDAAYGSLAWDVGSLSRSPEGWTVGRPYFVDPENGDWRVRACSKACECAADRSAAVWSDSYWKYATSDLDGRRVALRAGSPVAGCRQEVCAERGVYVAAAAGGMSVAAGWHALDAGESIEVAAAAGSRPCIGYVYAGETNLFDTVPTRVIAAADCPNGVALEAIYSSHWYVDATKSDDSGLAYSPASAKKTFAGLFGTGAVQAGDTVHAAEGVYDSGVMYRAERDADSGNPLYVVGARLIVPSYVTVVADGSQAGTVIRGASSASENEYGLGPDAVRCVTLYGNARIRGFTIENGRTDANVAIGTEKAKEFLDNTGALVQGATCSDVAAETAVAEDCRLRNGTAYRGGGASYAHLVRCRVTGCLGTDGSGAAGASMRCYHIGTAVYDNPNGYVVMYPYSFINSTIVHNSTDNRAFYRPSSNDKVKNSVIASGGTVQGTKKFVNTIFRSQLNSATEEMLDENSRVVGAENLVFDDEARPVIGSNVCVDAGSDAVYSDYRAQIGDTDASGVSRVLNGRIDVGALEADWRPVFAGRICLSGVPRIEVTEVSSAVTNGVNGVDVPGGATIAFKPTKPGKVVFSVNATGGGEVTVTEDGEAVLPGADGRYAIFGGEGEHRVVVACTGGDGAYATVYGLCSGKGAKIIFR